MRITRLELENFRGFEKEVFEFHQQLSVIIGINASGKTSLLRGLSVALGGWTFGFVSLSTEDKRMIWPSEKRVVEDSFYEMGAGQGLVMQTPIRVKCDATFEKHGDISWERKVLTAKPRAQTIFRGKDLKSITDSHDEAIRKRQDIDLILPLLVYYGTSRLHREQRQNEKAKIRNRLSGYRKALNDASTMKDSLEYLDTINQLADSRQATPDALMRDQLFKSTLTQALQSVMPGSTVGYNLWEKSLYIESPAGLKMFYSQVSDGYRNIINLIVDICRRMMELNPQLGGSTFKDTPGVVLIDEIDLHLHPRWQQTVLSDLQTIFPKIQFIVTTHAPAVIQSVKRENLIKLGDGEIGFDGPEVYGKDTNGIMKYVMDVNSRPAFAQSKIDDVYKLIEAKDYEGAKIALSELEKEMDMDDTELHKLRVTIDLAEIDW